MLPFEYKRVSCNVAPTKSIVCHSFASVEERQRNPRVQQLHSLSVGLFCEYAFMALLTNVLNTERFTRFSKSI